MAKIEEKKQVVEDIKQKLDAATLVICTDYRGLNVEQVTQLRNNLRVPGVEYRVLKNTMFRFALQQCGYEDIAAQITGPNAVIFSNEDPVGPAKTITEFARTNKQLEIKMAILEGKYLSADAVKDLANLPSREMLLAQVVGTMQAPISSFVRVLNANLTGLVRALDGIREQKQAG
ncbi:MAG TPA: 50S ribosomal protein L10 [Syntrophomonadaceae bacterium]|jgi:large subunit ribosomal protein L10|nr:50S ribosomal protein L10 [Syntrophomonadaceae bacterium]